VEEGIQHNTKQQTAQELHAEACDQNRIKADQQKRSITIMSHLPLAKDQTT